MTQFRSALLGGFASIVVLVVGWEFGLRLIEGVSFDLSLNFVGRDLGAAIHSAGGRNRYDPTLGWVLRDNIISKGARFTTGALGLRLHNSVTSDYPAGAILAVGDSFTAGAEVSDQDSWPAHLESILRHPVLNGANGGYSSGQIVLRAEDLAEKLKPSVLVVSFLDQDILRDGYRTFQAPKPYFDIVDGRLELRNIPVPRTDEMATDTTLVRRMIGHSYFLYKLSLYTGFYDWLIAPEAKLVRVHTNEVATRISCLLLERLANFGKARSLPIIFMMQYGGAASVAKEPSWYGRDVMRCARKLDFAATIDTHPILHNIAVRDIEELRSLYMMHDNKAIYGHMSPKGNRLIAELVADKIKAFKLATAR